MRSCRFSKPICVLIVELYISHRQGMPWCGILFSTGDTGRYPGSRIRHARRNARTGRKVRENDG